MASVCVRRRLVFRSGHRQRALKWRMLASAKAGDSVCAVWCTRSTACMHVGGGSAISHAGAFPLCARMYAENRRSVHMSGVQRRTKGQIVVCRQDRVGGTWVGGGTGVGEGGTR